MKKINTFWKIVILLVLIITITVLTLICIRIYDYECRVYSSESLSSTCNIDKYLDGRYRVYNLMTKDYTTPRLDWIAKASDKDTLAVFSKKGKRGYLNKITGEIIIKPQYEHVWLFSEGMAAAVLNGKLGFINTKNEVVLPFKFNYISNAENKVDFMFKNGLCTAIDTNGKYGLINKKGEWALYSAYDYINNPLLAYRIVKSNNKYGVINDSLRLIIPIEYENIIIQRNGFVLYKDYMQQLIAFDTKTIIEPIVYDEIQIIMYSSGSNNSDGEEILYKTKCMVYRMHNKWGLLSAEGKILSKAIYDNIYGLTDELFGCQIGGTQITLNYKGEKVN